MNLIGLDIGTTTIGGVLYSLKERKTLRTEVRNNGSLRENPEEYLQDPAAIEGQVRAILDGLIEASADEIGGISLSAQMHGILYVDREGRPVTSYYTWQNQRGLAPAGETTLEKEVSHALGYPVFSGYGIVTHTSLEREGLIPREAAKLCNIGDYVMMRLAGNREPVTDITLGASMGIASVQTGALAVSGEIFPRIVTSTERLGTYRGIPLIQPIGDNQASFLGSVKNRENSLLLNYGTAGQISFAGRGYASYPHFETRPLGNEGCLFAAFSLCGGKSYSLMADFFAAAAGLFSHGESRNPFAVMDGMALDLSDKEIDCLPLFLGERDGSGEFAWFRNITDRNFTPQNMVKALVQGMAGELHRFYRDLPGEVRESRETRVGAGNGIRKNPHLIRAAEHLYSLPVRLLDLSEESCLGAVINAGKGIGLFRDYGEGADTIVRYISPR